MAHPLGYDPYNSVERIVVFNPRTWTLHALRSLLSLNESPIVEAPGMEPEQLERRAVPEYPLDPVQA